MEEVREQILVCYKYADGRQEAREVFGIPVFVHESLKTFAYISNCSRYVLRWEIVEYSTGLSLNTEGFDLDVSLKSAQENIEKYGIEETLRRIENAIPVTKLPPFVAGSDIERN